MLHHGFQPRSGLWCAVTPKKGPFREAFIGFKQLARCRSARLEVPGPKCRELAHKTPECRGKQHGEIRHLSDQWGDTTRQNVWHTDCGKHELRCLGLCGQLPLPREAVDAQLDRITLLEKRKEKTGIIHSPPAGVMDGFRKLPRAALLLLRNKLCTLRLTSWSGLGALRRRRGSRRCRLADTVDNSTGS